MTYIYNYKFKRIFCILTLIGLWISLDAHFINFKLESFKNFSNLLRATIPFFIFIVLIINLKKNYIKNFFKENNKIYMLSFILITIQIPGLIYTENSILNISFVINCLTYLLFLSFFIENSNKLNFFLRISLILLIIIFTTYSLGLLRWVLINSKNINLYGSWPHALVDFNFSDNVPRSSGIARNAMILYIVFSILVIVKKINIFSIFILSLSFLIISLTQSRVVNIFFIGYLIVYLFIIFYLNAKILKKIFILIVTLILPLIATASFIYFQKNKSASNEIIVGTQKETNIKKKKILDKNYNTFFRPINDKNVGFGSGRIKDWKNIILKNKNYLIGYGAMGDRYLINQSASNFFIYIYASSGILGLIIGILFFTKVTFYTIKKILDLKFKITKKNYKFFILFVIIIFILFRSLAESSFGIFGIDYLIFMGSLHYILLKNKKINKII
jgi:hypothetical protein